MDSFKNALKIITSKINAPLNKISKEMRESVQEIRLRVNSPLCVTIASKNLFVSSDGELTRLPNENTVICDKIDVSQCFSCACEHSVYAYISDINQGFITISGGNRIGICGTAVLEMDRIKSVKNITSMNIRIAREYKFASKKIIDYFSKYGLKNTLIIGPPSSGKTTILRDLAYQLSAGIANRIYRTCIVDERYEIAAANGMEFGFDLGYSCDVLSGYKKSVGIVQAIRTLNPETIIFDEISTISEMNACKEVFYAGAVVITSIHAKDYVDFSKRELCKKIVDSKLFNCFVFLSEKAGEYMTIMNEGEIINAFCRNSYVDDSSNLCGNYVS